MAEKKSKRNTYQIVGRVVVITGVEVDASSYEEAVEKSKELGVLDFVDIPGDHMDSSLSIASVARNDLWNVD